MENSWQEASKGTLISPSKCTEEQIKIGALLRIAEALEEMLPKLDTITNAIDAIPGND